MRFVLIMFLIFKFSYTNSRRDYSSQFMKKRLTLKKKKNRRFVINCDTLDFSILFLLINKLRVLNNIIIICKIIMFS